MHRCRVKTHHHPLLAVASFSSALRTRTHTHNTDSTVPFWLPQASLWLLRRYSRRASDHWCRGFGTVSATDGSPLVSTTGWVVLCLVPTQAGQLAYPMHNLGPFVLLNEKSHRRILQTRCEALLTIRLAFRVFDVVLSGGSSKTLACNNKHPNIARSFLGLLRHQQRISGK